MLSPTEDLQQKIRLILSQVGSSPAIYTVRRAPLLAPSTGGGRDVEPAKPGDVEFANEQVLLLRTLYTQCSPALKSEFLRLLLVQLHEHGAEVVVHATLEIGELSDLKLVLEDPNRLALGTRLRLWRTIHQKLTMESHLFTETDLSLLDLMRNAELDRLPEPPPRPRGIHGIPRAG